MENWNIVTKMDKAYTSLMNCLTNKMHMFKDYLCCLRGGDNGEGGMCFPFLFLKIVYLQLCKVCSLFTQTINTHLSFYCE